MITDPLLLHYINSPNDVPTQKLAYVVPAFHAIKNTIRVKNKSHLIQLMHAKEVVVFGGDNHAPSNFVRWKDATKPFCTNPKPVHEYEPYMVLPTSATRYDERFTGYSKNKKSHALALLYSGWVFVVSPNTAVTHQPHPRSRKYQSDGKALNSMTWRVHFTYC